MGETTGIMGWPQRGTTEGSQECNRLRIALAVVGLGGGGRRARGAAGAAALPPPAALGRLHQRR